MEAEALVEVFQKLETSSDVATLTKKEMVVSKVTVKNTVSFSVMLETLPDLP